MTRSFESEVRRKLLILLNELLSEFGDCLRVVSNECSLTSLSRRRSAWWHR